MLIVMSEQLVARPADTGLAGDTWRQVDGDVKEEKKNQVWLGRAHRL